MVRKVNQDFFKTWTSDMAYILGFLYADGNISSTKRSGHYIAIYSADRSLLKDIRQCWQSDHKLSKRSVRSGSVYRIQIGSKEWFTDLGILGLSPNKTKRLELPTIPNKFFGDFVRGYFDGDGNVWSGIIHKHRKNPTPTLQVFFTSGSHGYVVALRSALQERGIQGGGIYVSKKSNFSRLILSIQDAIKLYEIMYNGPHSLFLKRKKVVFDRFIKMRA